MQAHDHPKNHANETARRDGLVTRRTVLAGIAAGVLGGANLPAAGQKENRPGDQPQREKPGAGIPGPFPGRVVEIAHAGSVVEDAVQEAAATAMVERGMRELVGSESAVEA